jgi:hypothetical protein
MLLSSSTLNIQGRFLCTCKRDDRSERTRVQTTDVLCNLCRNRVELHNMSADLANQRRHTKMMLGSSHCTKQTHKMRSYTCPSKTHTCDLGCFAQVCPFAKICPNTLIIGLPTVRTMSLFRDAARLLASNMQLFKNMWAAAKLQQ